MGLKEKIAAACDRAPRKIEVPEWGAECIDKLFIRKLSVNERKTLAAINQTETSSDDDFWTELVHLALVDSDGASVFASSADVLETLGDKNEEVVDRLLTEMLEYCLPSKKRLKDMEKNSETSRNDALPSGSAESLESSTLTISETFLPPNSLTSGGSTVA